MKTGINTRPAISFYNDNNPDWLNVMIFYHVLAHIDLFQNNIFFRHTWDYDFNGSALSDKRIIARLRSEKGRWVDYLIEFSRSIDNLVGFHEALSRLNRNSGQGPPSKLDYYFDVFLQNQDDFIISQYIAEIDRYNQCQRENPTRSEDAFFAEIERNYPEFQALYQKHRESHVADHQDLLEFVVTHSEFLNKDENLWMKTVIHVVRQTALFFQPQIRTKIMHEGWASYWHEKLFLQDDRIEGHEVEYARVNAGVTSLPRVGLNPYALGMRLFQYIEEAANQGRYDYRFQRLQDARTRERYDAGTGEGLNHIFNISRNYCDFMFINEFVDQDFVDRHRLFVAGKRLNRSRMTWEYFVQSRDADQYRKMLIDSLYHPPCIEVDHKRSEEGPLVLIHRFEGKPLVNEFIANTMLGIEYLWGKPVILETTERLPSIPVPEPVTVAVPFARPTEETPPPVEKWQHIRYTMKNRQLTRDIISE